MLLPNFPLQVVILKSESQNTCYDFLSCLSEIEVLQPQLCLYNKWCDHKLHGQHSVEQTGAAHATHGCNNALTATYIVAKFQSMPFAFKWKIIII